MKTTHILAFIITLFIYTASFSQSVVINEFMSSNSKTIADENGDYEDWIELYNPTNESVNLEGWGLSDNESKPYKWVFPDITIAPNDYLLVWASGKDLVPSQNTVFGVERNVYDYIRGGYVYLLTKNAAFTNQPSETEIITDHFASPVNQKYSYGQRIHGVFEAPQTGNYTFWIASDDHGLLYLSEDSTARNMKIIASVDGWTGSRDWNKYSSQQSKEIFLEAGEKYYLSALAKQATGGDNLAVGWQLPDGTLERPIPASYFTTYSNNELHTNFSLSSDGEPLILTDNLGNTVHYIPEVKLATDVSYGLKRDGSGFGYFANSTPDKENSDKSYDEISFDEVQFSHQGGFYDEEFLLELNSDNPNAKIYYTLDGSTPSPYNLDGAEYSYAVSYPFGVQEPAEIKTYLYNGGIEIKDKTFEDNFYANILSRYSSNLNYIPQNNIYKGNVIRAIAVEEDVLYPMIAGRSYFVSDDEGGRFDLPVVSIISDPIGLFDYEKGIYVSGKIVDDWKIRNEELNFHGLTMANYNQRGRKWERTADFSVFDTKTNKSYSTSAGLRIHGNITRAFEQKSLRLYSRLNDNGFKYPFFNDLKSKADTSKSINTFHRLLLRNSGNDFHFALYRDALIQSVLKFQQVTTMAYQPVIHFLNGEYWGIINLRERYDRYYLASHFNISKDDVAILEHNTSIDSGTLDDQRNFNEIIDFSLANDLFKNENIELITKKVNIESMFQYYSAQIYIVNMDWPQNNQRLWRYRKGIYEEEGVLGLDGRWSWMIYDTDHGFNFENNTVFKRNEILRILSNETDERVIQLFREILKNESAQNRFINIVSDQINSCFKPDYVHSKVDEFNARLASSRAEHYNRWRSGNDEGETIKIFATERPAYMRDHTRDYFNLGDDIDIVVSKKGDGKVQLNSLLIDENLPGISDIDAPYPWSGVYYADVPVQLKAVDTKTAIFSHWEGDIPVELKNNREIEIAFSENSSVTAVFTEAIFEVVHYWHFNDLAKGELTSVESDFSATLDKGIITYTGSGDGYMDRVKEGTELNAQEGVEDGNALRVRNPSDSRSLQFSAPTDGFENIKLSYAVTRTSKGSEEHSVSYRISSDDEWVLLRENIVATESFRKVDFDLSDIYGVEDNSEFALKIDFTGEAASGASGNNRFDNIILSGVVMDKTVINVVERDGDIFKLYPNPARDVVNIVSVSSINSVEIYDSRGSLVYNSGNLRERREYSVIVDVSGYLSGVYIAKVVTEDKVEVRKFVVRD